jgi:hypothetical protein
MTAAELSGFDRTLTFMAIGASSGPFLGGTGMRDNSRAREAVPAACSAILVGEFSATLILSFATT